MYTNMAESEVECFNGVPEVICVQSHTTTYMSRHNSRWLARHVPPPSNNPINARALSLSHRLSLFSEVSYSSLAAFSFRASRSFITRRSRRRALPSLNLKKKRDCSHSILSLLFTSTNYPSILINSLNVSSTYVLMKNKNEKTLFSFT